MPKARVASAAETAPSGRLEGLEEGLRPLLGLSAGLVHCVPHGA